MRSWCSIVIIIISVLIFSCQKEISPDNTNNPPAGGGNSNFEDIIGNWKFIEFNAKTKSTGTAVDPSIGSIKAITISDYTTINNGGTLKIEASKMTSTDLTYAVNSIAKSYLYENNVLVDSLEMPFEGVIPPSSSSATYKRVRSDSIYFNNGFFTNVSTGGSAQSTGGGIKLKLEGNKMFWTQIYKNTSVQNINGLSVTKVDEATLVSTFQRL